MIDLKRLVILFLLIAVPLYSQTASLSNLSPTYGGSGSYDSPWVLKSPKVKFKVYCSSNDNGATLYRASVHMAIGRACCVMYQSSDEPYSIAHEKTHTVTGLHTGNFYIKVDWLRDEGGKWAKQGYDKYFITCQVPPVNSYSAPYTPPAGSSPPTIVIDVSNVINPSAAGTESDPYYPAASPSDTTLYFSLANSTGMANGCFNYAIVVSGQHPHYYLGHDCNSKETYGYSADLSSAQWYNTGTFEGSATSTETCHGTSKSGLYKLDVYMYNQHGQRSVARKVWYVPQHDQDDPRPQPDPEPVPDPVDTTACPVPTGLEVYE